MNNDFQILLSAAIDQAKAQTKLNEQITKIKTEAIKLGVEIDTKSAKNAIKELSKEQQDLLSSNKIQLNNKISTYFQQNTKIGKDFRNELTNIQNKIKTVGNASELKALNNSFKEVSSSIKSMGQNGESTLGKFKSDLANFTTFLSAGTIIMTGINSIRQLISTVVDLDKSLVNLQQSTGYTSEQAKELLNTYIDLGQELGATGSEVADSAAQWLRQGKSIADTNTLIRDSMILSKVGQIEASQSTQLLTSAMKGYKVEVSGVLGIVDKLSAIDLNSATDVAGLAEAMSRTANGARIAGVEMDKLLGMIAVVGEVSQKSMDSVGESFKTIFARMGNVKLGKLVDEDGNDITTQINDVEKILDKVDIKLRDSATSFRDFGNVIDDVGGKWSDFSEVDQNAIANAFAGVRQRESFVTLMENYGDSLKYAEISANSSGTAMQKFAAYESSVEAKTKTLQASLQELSTDTLNSGVIKSFLDVSNVLVNAVDDVGLFNVAIVALLTTLNVKKGTVLIGFIDSLVAKMGLATGAATTLSFALSAIVPTVAILAGIKIIDALIVTIEEQEKILESANTVYEESKSELESINSELETTAKRIDELNNKDNLTFVEKGELDELKKVTQELLIQQDILQKERDYNAKNLAGTTVDTFNKKYGNSPISQGQVEEFTQNANMTGNNALLVSDANDISAMIAAYKQFTDLKQQAFDSKDNEEAARYQELLDEISNSLMGNVKDLTGLKEKLEAVPFDSLDEEGKTALTNINDAIKLVYNNLDPNKWKAIQFDTIFNSDEMASVKTQLEELAKAGELTPEVISSTKEYQKLLSDTGLTAQEVFDQISGSVETVTDTITNATTPLKSYKDIIDGVAKNAKMVAEAQYELSESGSLSYDTVSDLLEVYPELEKSLTLTADGYKISKGALDDLMTSQTSEYELAYNEAVDAANKFIDNEKLKKVGIDATTTAVKDQMYAMLKLYEQEKQATGDTLREIQNTPTYQSMLSAWMNVGTTESNLDKSKKVVKDIQVETTNTLIEKGKTKTKKSDDPYLDAYNTAKKTLDHQLAMDDITQTEYLNSLEKLNNKFFAKKKDKYLEQYRSNEEEIYKGRKSIADDLSEKAKKDAEEVAEKALEAQEKQIAGVIEKYKSAMSNTDKTASNSEKGSDNQFSAYANGLKIASDEVSYLETQITKLNKKYKNDKSNEDYTKQLENLTSQLGDAKDAMQSYQNSMIDNIASRLEDQTDEITKAYEDQKNAIENRYETELDALNDIIDAKKKSLESDKKAAEYAEDLADKTKAISDIDSRMTDLYRAANSGDREAQSELKKLQEERSKAQKDLDKTQADHKIDVEEEALDKLADDFKISSDKNKAIDLSNAKTIYDSKLANITALYKKEEELILHASEYTKSQFTSALQGINDQFTKLGVDNSGNTGAINSSYGSLVGNSKASSASSKNDEILAILSNGNASGEGTSALNKYIKSNYGTQLSYDQMAQVASKLGIKGVTSSNIKGDSETKDEILKKLKAAGFKTGGMVGLANSVGEDGYALVKNKEIILNQADSKTFKDFVPIMKDFTQSFKPNLPDFSKVITNNSSPITLSISVTGVNDKSLLSNINTAGNELLKNLSSEIRKIK